MRGFFLIGLVMLFGCAGVKPTTPTPTTPTSGYPAESGRSFRDQSWAPELVMIPAGRFMMGSTEEETTREKRAPEPAGFERPLHEVVFSKPFAIGKYDVTVAEFDRFVKATDRQSVLEGCTVDDHGKWGMQTNRSYRDPLFAQTDQHPAVCVTWNDAAAYAAWLTKETGHRYRLVREEEWEYAARAGTTTARWWGDSTTDLCRYANGADRSFDRDNPGDAQANLTCDDGYGGTNPGKHFPANPFGLHDMLGNAWQWTGECFRERYDAPLPDEAQCKRRVIRGGSWHNYPNVLRSANRFWLAPTNRSSSIGFRVARDPDASNTPSSK